MNRSNKQEVQPASLEACTPWIENPILDMLLQSNCRIAIMKINGQWRIVLRHIIVCGDTEHYLKKGVCLSMEQICALLHDFNTIDESMINKKDTRLFHIKNNMFVSVSNKFQGLNIRIYFNSENGLTPTKRGVFLRNQGWQNLRAILIDLENIILDIKHFTPCNIRFDHLSIIGRLGCPNCNPNSYKEWN